MRRRVGASGPVSSSFVPASAPALVSGVAVLGTIFFSTYTHHIPAYALQITAWACLAPLAVAFLLVFRLPMLSRDEQLLEGPVATA